MPSATRGAAPPTVGSFEQLFTVCASRSGPGRQVEVIPLWISPPAPVHSAFADEATPPVETLSPIEAVREVTDISRGQGDELTARSGSLASLLGIGGAASPHLSLAASCR